MLKQDGNVISLSVNPSYFCNYRCKGCYLTEEQLSDKRELSLTDLDDRLREIKLAGYQIGTVDLYGGEILLMPAKRIKDYQNLLLRHGAKDVEIITNLSTYNEEVIEDPTFGISVSFDFQEREQWDWVARNMRKIKRPFTILTLGVPGIVQSKHVDRFVEYINTFEWCRNWEIKPYSSNQANQLDVKFTDYEEFVKKVIEYKGKKNFRFLNEGAISASALGLNNSFSDDHVYITPNGKFGVLDFDSNDNEHFTELEHFTDYLEWTLDEKTKVYSNEFCSSCNYLGRCMSEHMRDVKSLDNSCSGFHNLIQWYETKPK